jgi:hypothetical protein
MNDATFITQSLFQEDLYQLPSRVLVVINKPWEQLADNDRTVLSKMLVAVRLSLAAVQIIEKTEFTLADIAPLSPSKVLVFGTRLQPPTKPYELVMVEGVPVITAESLDLLDDVKKKNLWTALKQMFAL